MQIGQTIWAIDPKETSVTFGNSYEIYERRKGVAFSVINEKGVRIWFEENEFDKYFSLTPPKEKEGELKLIELGNYGYLAILDGKHIVVHTVDKERALELLQRFDFSWSKVENIIATNIY